MDAGSWYQINKVPGRAPGNTLAHVPSLHIPLLFTLTWSALGPAVFSAPPALQGSKEVHLYSTLSHAPCLPSLSYPCLSLPFPLPSPYAHTLSFSLSILFPLAHFTVCLSLLLPLFFPSLSFSILLLIQFYSLPLSFPSVIPLSLFLKSHTSKQQFPLSDLWLQSFSLEAMMHLNILGYLGHAGLHLLVLWYLFQTL